MKKTFTVRLEDEEREDLENLARLAKKKAADIIRLAIENLVLDTRMNDGRLYLRKDTPAAQKFLAEEILDNLRKLYPHGVPDEFSPAGKRLSPWEEKEPAGKKPPASGRKNAPTSLPSRLRKGRTDVA